MFTLTQAIAQRYPISGTVYDITKKTPVEGVSVISTSGNGTFTDSLGHYTLTVNASDSIYFSYLNKPTPKFAVAGITNTMGFDISILRRVGELPNVFVKQRNYRKDSIQNREDYARIFNYRKPGLRFSTDPTPGGIGAGIDINELINVFRFRKNRSMLAFQDRLIKQEQDKFIDYRFSKGLVRKLTKLDTPDLEDFMKEFRPTYEMAVGYNDLELGQFMIEAFKYYAGQKAKQGITLHYMQ